MCVADWDSEAEDNFPRIEGRGCELREGPWINRGKLQKDFKQKTIQHMLLKSFLFPTATSFLYVPVAPATLHPRTV